MTDNLQRSLIIQTSNRDYQKNTNSGGGRPREFGDPEFARRAVLDQCFTLRAEMEEDAEQVGAAVPVKLGLARLVLKPTALAKSHRPVETFTAATCPIIGDGDELGEFLVVVTPDGLDRLEATVRRARSKQVLAHLTSIDTLTLARRDHRLPARERRMIEQQTAEGGRVRLKIRLLRYGLFTSVLQEELQKLLQSIPGIDASPYLELGDFLIYGASVQNIEQALAIASYPFIERISLMPRYGLSRMRLQEYPDVPIHVFAPFDNLPIVAVVDGGIDPASPLESLVWGRDAQVIASEADFTHGTAVGALAAAQNDMRSGMLIPRSQLLDVRIMKLDDEIDEDLFKMKMQHAVERFGDQVKIWNLSIAAKPGSRPTEFSELGRYLDRLQREHGILFFIAAGNCQEMRQWPYTIADENEEWIAAPGDSPCNMTVGAYAPDQAPPEAYAQAGSPSPFTPHGPGPYSTPKPNLSAPGGNATPSGMSIGIPTLSPTGCLMEMVGTSAAAPNVAGLASEILACIRRTHIHQDDELLILKALLMHHAIRPTEHLLGGNAADFYGFGKVNALENTLGDPFWRSTSLIQGMLYPDREDLLIDPFPYPEGLWRNGQFHGEIWLTMVSDPILLASRKQEYVRSDVEVTLACRKKGGKDPVFQLTPLHIGNGYEASRIKDEHKWSPIKQYYGNLSYAGTRGDSWHLSGKLLLRERESQIVRGEPDMVGQYGVKVVIALTIVDPTRTVEVSNQMVQQWRARGSQPIQFEIAQRIRAQFAL